MTELGSCQTQTQGINQEFSDGQTEMPTAPSEATLNDTLKNKYMRTVSSTHGFQSHRLISSKNSCVFTNHFANLPQLFTLTHVLTGTTTEWQTNST